MYCPAPFSRRLPALLSAPALSRGAAVISFAAALIIASIIAPAGALAQGTAWYVSPTGDDTAPGTAAQPFATIQHAITASADGDSVMLADGEYSGPGNRDIDMQGKAIRVASISMDPLQCVINCDDADSTPHLGFIFSGFYNDRPELAGLTVTGATAIGANQGAIQLPDNGLPIDKSAAPADAAELTRAMKVASAAPILRRLHVMGNTGNGFYVGYHRTVFSAHECEFSGNTGNGGVTRNEMSFAGEFYDCRFNGNGEAGLVHGASSFGLVPANFHRCQFNSNGADGFAATQTLWQEIEFIDCGFIGNGGNGALCIYDSIFTNCIFADNGGWGLHHAIFIVDPSTAEVTQCEVVNNGLGGIRSKLRSGNSITGGAVVTETTISNNGGPGIVNIVNMLPKTVSNCVVVGNEGPGIILHADIPSGYPYPANGRCNVTDNTIAANGGPGLVFVFAEEPEQQDVTYALAIDHSIICQQDTSVSFAGFLPDTLTVACTDIFDNASGDWTGLLASFANSEGNLSVDPLFCAAANPSDPWTLHADSPLAAENNVACGQIGARGTACASTVVACRSVHVYDPVTGAYDPNQLNREVTVEGVVYVAPGTYSDTGGGYLQDETGGINFWRSPVPENIHVGDRIRITGPIWPWIGELHIGTYTYTKLDSLLSPLPVTYTLANLLGDFGNTGSHVSVTGTVSSLTAESFQLVDGAHSIEVRRNAYGQVDFGVLTEGDLCTVSGPCFKQEGVLYLMPPRQASMTTSPLRYVAVDGDDGNPGSQSRPFRTIERAVSAAAAGDTVLVSDGIYTGDGNRDLNFRGKAIVLRSISDNPEACIIDCAGTSSDPHYAFWFHSGEDTTAVVQGFTITGAYAAPPAFAAIMGNFGPHLNYSPEIGHGTATLRNLVITSNQGNGISSYTKRCGPSMGGGTFRLVDTRSNSNSGFGYQVVGEEMRVNRIDHCQFNGNGTGGLDLTGFTTGPPGGKIIADSEIRDNGGSGISGHNCVWMTLQVIRCQIADNEGWGVRFFDGLFLSNVAIERNRDGGVYVGNTTADPLAIQFKDSTIADNLGDGIVANGFSMLSVRFERLQVSGNAARGIALTSAGIYGVTTWTDLEVVDNADSGIDLVRGSPSILANSTIANNGGCGIRYDLHDNATLEVSNTVIAFNDQAAWLPASESSFQPNPTCSNVYGNQGGNWTGALAGYEGLNGNLRVDPEFCAPGTGDYHLQADSPLAAANNIACGTIGRLDVNCPADPGSSGVTDLPATAFVVAQNVPNPFNPFTTIRFNLPASAPVTAGVFDLAGRRIRALVSGVTMASGPHELTWDGHDNAGRQAPSGSYHFRLEAAGESRTMRMMLLK